MSCNCWDGAFAVLILIFSFWRTDFSEIIIVISAALILIKSILIWSSESCSVCRGMDHRTGSEIFVDKNQESNMPSRKEVEETFEKGMPKKSIKKSAKKKNISKKK